MIRTWVIVTLIALTMSLTTSDAVAQDPDEPMKTAAKALYNEAREARKSDDFATCYAKSTAAWSIHKHPSIAALVGDCAVGIGKHRDGADKLQFFFDSPKQIGSAELRTHLQTRLDEAKKHIAVVTLSVSVPDAACDVDGKRVDPLPATVFLDPGSHVFEARHPNHVTETRQVNVAAGTSLAIQLDLKLTPAPKPDPTPAEPEPSMAYVIGAGVSGVVAAGGLALMIASVVLHENASSDIARYDAEVGSDTGCDGVRHPSCDPLDSAISDQTTFSALFPVGIVIAGVGLAATGTFLILHFTGPDSAEASLHVSPTGLAVRGRF